MDEAYKLLKELTPELNKEDFLKSVVTTKRMRSKGFGKKLISEIENYAILEK
ncbi:MAG: hypothetical protein AB1Z20_00840 [Desulfobacterales bacterium]